MGVGCVEDGGRKKTGRGRGGWSNRAPHVYRKKNSDTALFTPGHTETPIRSAPPISPHRRTSHPHSLPSSTHTYISSHPTSSTPLLPEPRNAAGRTKKRRQGGPTPRPREAPPSPSPGLFLHSNRSSCRISWNATGRARSLVQTRLKRQRVKRTVLWSVPLAASHINSSCFFTAPNRSCVQVFHPQNPTRTLPRLAFDLVIK